jgi:hypothetical protein
MVYEDRSNSWIFREFREDWIRKATTLKPWSRVSSLYLGSLVIGATGLSTAYHMAPALVVRVPPKEKRIRTIQNLKTFSIHFTVTR